MDVDPGLLFGVAGFVTGSASLLYARTQARAALRQAEAANRLTTMQMQESLAARVRASRATIAGNPRLREEYLAANPKLREVFEPIGVETVMDARAFIDAFEDVHNLRRAGFIDAHTWHAWTVQIGPLLRMPSCRALFENAVGRGLFAPDFVEEVRAVLAERDPSDPGPR